MSFFPRGTPSDFDDKPSLFFLRRVADLIVQGRFGRAHREVARWNAGHRERLRLLPTKAEQVRWAERILEQAAAQRVMKALNNA